MTQYQKHQLLMDAIHIALSRTRNSAYDSGLADATAAQSPDTHTDSDVEYYGSRSCKSSQDACTAILDAVRTYESA